MQPIKDSYSIVMLGAWNPNIFNQEWIINHITEPSTENITMAFPLDDPTAPRKISFEDINLFPGRKQLLLQPEEPSIEGMKKCSSILAKILNLLTHTPVTFCGINFSFEEKIILDKLYPLFSFDDSETIPEEKYALKTSTIIRKFQLSDENILNLELTHKNGNFKISFNFHHTFHDIQKYCQLFQSDYIQQKFNESLDFCQRTYNLNIEDE